MPKSNFPSINVVKLWIQLAMAVGYIDIYEKYYWHFYLIQENLKVSYKLLSTLIHL